MSITPAVTFTVRFREATNATLRAVFKENGKLIDLTAFAQVNFHVNRPPGNTDLDITATLVSLGVADVLFVPADLVAGDGQLAYFDLIDGSALATTSDNILLDVIPR